MADRTTHHYPFHLAELRDSLCPPSKKIARTLGAQAGKSYISKNKNTFYHESSAFTPPHFILRPDCQSIGLADRWLTLSAQPLPDPIQEAPSPAHQYYLNQGQLINSQGQLVPEIKYYTERSSPALYLADDKVSFVYHKVDTMYWSQPDSPRVDTSYRLDMRFACRDIQTRPDYEGEREPCGTLKASEPGSDHLNYYLPHCAQGITQVPGYHRVVYEEAFPKIDVHLYSNAMGLKAYFVIKPGGDPNDITLEFEGQDSLGTLITGQVEMYLRQKKWAFPQATAYQISGGTPVPLTWLPSWYQVGSDQIKIITSGYNTAQPLVLRVAWPIVVGNTPLPKGNLCWSTYYGDNGYEYNVDVKVNASEDLFILTQTLGDSQFPGTSGAQEVNSFGSQDVYLSKFDYGVSREWGTYFGGTNRDSPTELGLNEQNEVYITGHTKSDDIPITGGGGYSQTQLSQPVTNTEPNDAMILSFDQMLGFRQWTSYFGGDGDEQAYSIEVDEQKNRLFIGGRAFPSSSTSIICAANTSNAFPTCNGGAYFQGNVQGVCDGFLAEFDLSSHQLLWSTYFGGIHEDYVYDIVSTESGLYISGATLTWQAPTNPSSPLPAPTNGAFPLANPGGGAYFQSVGSAASNISDGFISKFDPERQLIWSTFVGGAGEDFLSSLAVNSVGDVFAVGATNTTSANSIAFSCLPTTSSSGLPLLPLCDGNGLSYLPNSVIQSDYDMLITRFSPSGSLLWSTIYGGTDSEEAWKFYAGGQIFNHIPQMKGHDLTIDAEDNLFVSGSTFLRLGGVTTFPSVPYSNYYYQSTHGGIFPPSNTIQILDAFIVGFNSNNQRFWSTHFGGREQLTTYGANGEIGLGIASFSDEYLYMVGQSETVHTPQDCPSQITGPPYCDPTLNQRADGFIARFCLDGSSGNPTSVREPENPNRVVVFPNPIQNTLRMKLEIARVESVNIEIINHLGQVCFAQSVTLRPQASPYEVSVPNL